MAHKKLTKTSGSRNAAKKHNPRKEPEKSAPTAETAALGARIAELRDKLKINNNELARRLGWQPQLVRKYINGEVGDQWVKITNIARVLKTTPNHLLGFSTAVDDRSLHKYLANAIFLAQEEGPMSPSMCRGLVRSVFAALRDLQSLPADQRTEREAQSRVEDAVRLFLHRYDAKPGPKIAS